MSRKFTRMQDPTTLVEEQLVESAAFRQLLEEKRTTITRAIDDIDGDIKRLFGDIGALRHRHADLTYLLAMCDAARAIAPLPPAVEVPPAVIEHREDA